MSELRKFLTNSADRSCGGRRPLGRRPPQAVSAICLYEFAVVVVCPVEPGGAKFLNALNTMLSHLGLAVLKPEVASAANGNGVVLLVL